MKKKIIVTGKPNDEECVLWVSASTNKQGSHASYTLARQENVLLHHCQTILKEASLVHILCWLILKKCP